MLLLLICFLTSFVAWAEPEDLLRADLDRSPIPTSGVPLKEKVEDLSQELNDLALSIRQLQNRVLKLETRVSVPELSDRSSLKDNVSEKESVPEKKKAAEIIPLSRESIPPGWQEGPMPSEDKAAAFEKEKADKYQEAQKALTDGYVEKARTLFQEVREEDKGHGAEALYWLGTIALLQDKKPKEAAALFSKAYKEAEKGKKGSVLFRQSVLLKLSESLLAMNQKGSARTVLDQFFQLNSEEASLSEAEKKNIKRLMKKAKAIKERLSKDGPKEDDISD